VHKKVSVAWSRAAAREQEKELEKEMQKGEKMEKLVALAAVELLFWKPIGKLPVGVQQ